MHRFKIKSGLSRKEWIDKGLIGSVSEVKVWTNRPVWPQGIVRPKPTVATVADVKMIARAQR